MVVLVSLSLLIIIFSALASIHFYWALGGRWGINEVVPVNTKGEKILNTSALASVMVETILLFFAIYYLNKLFTLIVFPDVTQQSIGWFIPSIFLARAIGDFNYVGFFKRIRHSTFEKLDTRYFSTLCLLISFLGIVIVTSR